jgi:hypothetical protein
MNGNITDMNVNVKIIMKLFNVYIEIYWYVIKIKGLFANMNGNGTNWFFNVMKVND